MTATPRHYWQTRPPANRLGDAPWRHGRLHPMPESKPRWWPFNRKDR